MLRLILTAFVILGTLLNAGCFNNSDKAHLSSSQTIGEVEMYTFSPDPQYLLSDAQPFILPPDTMVKDALDSLGRHLAKNYFSKTYTNRVTDIHFNILKINEISTSSRSLRIAVIDMVDTNRDAVRYFFQGSTGGQTTFFMLTATFLQPHLTPPLLDGLVLLYNGEMLPELVHINLTGILTPTLVKRLAYRAVYGTKI